MPDNPALTELQLAILSVLWGRGEATSAQVRGDLAPTHSLALTTVTTLLGRLEKKGVVGHRRDGRRYLYRATVPREEVRRYMVTELTDSLFEGDPSLLVDHVLTTRDLSREDIHRVRNLVEAMVDGTGSEEGRAG